MNEQFTQEQRLLLLTSRLTFTETEKEEILEILKNHKVNMFEVFKMAMYHKVATLCWYNMCKIMPNMKMPKYLYSLLRYTYYDVAEQNEMYLKARKEVMECLKEHDIIVIPVKGASLVNELYQPYGTRYMGDLDFLVKKKDAKKLEDCLTNQLGYCMGDYNSKTEKIEPISRAENLKWKTYMSNFYPYRKLTGDVKNPMIKLDFRYSLDDSLDPEPINEIIDHYICYGEAAPAHILIHLCAHFYAEAKHTSTIYMSKDFNLIKLCDIREYIIAYVKDKDLDELVDFSCKYNLEKQVYFTFYYLKLTYDDSCCEKVMKRYSIQNFEFLHTFGENTLKADTTVRKSYWNLLFDCGNSEMLEGVPSLYRDQS